MSNKDMAVEPDADAGIGDLEADLQLTREQLGDTIDAIGAKLDVKAQVKDTATHARDNVVDSTAHAKQAVVDKVTDIAESDTVTSLRARPGPVLAALGITVLVVALVWRRTR